MTTESVEVPKNSAIQHVGSISAAQSSLVFVPGNRAYSARNVLESASCK